ncbi:AfsR/SARP family transcriptional regulator [Actinokineospora bangkokensis]|uniref:OmpR/PhoB-type domain-containing protein n=1 Tax=Actinokineospora bangkokensis TaxID=1193682 RepID=A0A1Q9LLB0_9PSEU|nr:BTAD domain-containing putative transcriptional regulator [Actinokineospora bangkokensis]OLR92811.1 hypothetical protein BJP25_19470 [Actinokineospora bangkokensis]
MAVAVRVLGDLVVMAHGEEIVVTAAKQRGLLRILALHRGGALATDELVALLWDGNPPKSARTTLRGYVRRLRAAVAEPIVESVAAGYRIAASASVDLTEFHAKVAAARHCTHPRRELELLREAVVLWRGDPLQGLTGDWAETFSSELEQDRLHAVERLLRLELQVGDPGVIADTARKVLRHHPFREQLWHTLLSALHATNRTAEALAAYAEFRITLAHNLGIDPSPALRRLHQHLLDNTLVTPAARSGPPTRRSRPPRTPARPRRRPRC